MKKWTRPPKVGDKVTINPFAARSSFGPTKDWSHEDLKRIGTKAFLTVTKVTRRGDFDYRVFFKYAGVEYKNDNGFSSAHDGYCYDRFSLVTSIITLNTRRKY